MQSVSILLQNTTKPKYNMMFLLTAGGKFNYQGSRQWLEEHIDKQTGNYFSNN